MEPFERFFGLMDTAEPGAGGGAPKPKIGVPGRQPQTRQPEPEPEPDYEAQGYDEDGGYEQPEEPQPQAQPENDWRKQAMDDPEVRARFDQMFLGSQQQPQEPQPPQEDPLDVAERELSEIDAEMEKMGQLTKEQLKDPEAVTHYFELQDKRGRKATEVARLAAQRSRNLERQQYASRQEQRNFADFARQDPNFTEDVQAEFLQYLDSEGISADLRAEPYVFQTVAKSFLYERVGAPGGKRQKMPAPPIGQGHSRQPAPAKPQEPADPLAEEKARFWGTSSESVSKHTSSADGKPLKYDKSGHDVPYMRYSDTGRRRRRSA